MLCAAQMTLYPTVVQIQPESINLLEVNAANALSAKNLCNDCISLTFLHPPAELNGLWTELWLVDRIARILYTSLPLLTRGGLKLRSRPPAITRSPLYERAARPSSRPTRLYRDRYVRDTETRTHTLRGPRRRWSYGRSACGKLSRSPWAQVRLSRERRAPKAIGEVSVPVNIYSSVVRDYRSAAASSRHICEDQPLPLKVSDLRDVWTVGKVAPGPPLPRGHWHDSIGHVKFIAV
ncbi:unnamed protein product, partial [Iphiclides podalirius]